MASSAPPAGPANSGGGEQSTSNHLPSSSDSPVSPVRSETPPSSRQRFENETFNSESEQLSKIIVSLIFSSSAPVRRSDGSEGPVSSRLRHLPGRYLSTSQLPVSTPSSPFITRSEACC